MLRLYLIESLGLLVGPCALDTVRPGGTPPGSLPGSPRHCRTAAGNKQLVFDVRCSFSGKSLDLQCSQFIAMTRQHSRERKASHS